MVPQIEQSGPQVYEPTMARTITNEGSPPQAVPSVGIRAKYHAAVAVQAEQ